MLPLPGAWPRGSVASSPVDARRALLGRLIDHAALFPPASLPVPDALAEDRRARASEHAWMLGRFVCPASKLAELGGEERALTVVADAPADDPRIESIETRMLARCAGEVFHDSVGDNEVGAGSHQWAVGIQLGEDVLPGFSCVVREFFDDASTPDA